ncbi:MAG: hypothetical protein IT361_05960 [Gemmatimonadaceae bacterium]|nr:hypothetical protein [Gemmatimonadaceae bacterium]
MAQTACANAYRFEAVPGNPSTSLRGYDVVLVHGYVPEDNFPGDDCTEAQTRRLNDYWHFNKQGVAGAEWTSMVQHLQANGVRVFGWKWPTFNSISHAGDSLQVEILREVQSKTLGPYVVLVGHSFGGLVSLRALTQGSGLRSTVIRVLTLGSPHQGTDAGWSSGSLAQQEALPGSPFLSQLRSARMQDASMIYAFGGRRKSFQTKDCSGLGVVPDPQGNDDCVVAVTSAYDGQPGDVGGLVRETLNGAEWFGYTHTQIKLDYTGEIPADVSQGTLLRSALDRLLVSSLRPVLAANPTSPSIPPNGSPLPITITNANVGGVINGVTVSELGAPSGWLGWQLSTPTVGPGGAATLSLRRIGGTLSPGRYQATLQIAANGATPITVSVWLDVPVVSGPTLTVSKSTVGPGETFTLNWTVVPGATRYTVERSKDRSYTDLNPLPPTTQTTASDAIAVSGVPITIYYRVRADNSSASNEVSVTAIPTPVAGNMSATPASLLLNGIVGGGKAIADVTLRIQGQAAFTWCVSGTTTGGVPNWFEFPRSCGNETQVPIQVRANPQGLTAGQYSGFLDISSPQGTNSPLRLPVTFDVRSGTASGVDLIIDTAYIDYAYHDPRDPTKPRSQIQYFWRVKNIGVNAVPGVPSGYGRDHVYWGTSPSPQAICQGSVNLNSNVLNRNRGIAPGGTLTQSERDNLPPQAYTVGQSYLLFLTDGDWNSGTCIGLPGLIAETNESNNHFVLPIYIPKPPVLILPTTTVTMPGTVGEVLAQVVGYSNAGDQPLVVTATTSDSRLIATVGSSSINLSTSAAAWGPGTWPATVQVASNGGNASIPVSVVVTAAPTIVASLTPNAFTTTTTATGSLSISNGGGGSLAWSITGGPSWATLSAASGVGAQVVTVTASASGLHPGNHQGVLTIAAPFATNSPMQVPLSLTVPAPNLFAAPVISITPGLPSSIDPISVTATLQNTGQASAGPFTWQLLVDGSVAVSQRIASGLGAGASASVNAVVGPLSPGSHLIEVRADALDEIPESSETDNSSQRSVTVTLPPKPNLMVAPIAVAPASPTDTEQLSVTGSIVNAGSAAAPSFTWNLIVDGQVMATRTVNSGLQAGSSSQFSELVGPLAAGSRIVEVRVDPGGFVDELSETDNAASQSVTVSPTPRIDLVPGAVTMTPTNPTTSQVVTFTASVTNTGNTTARSVGWRFLVDGQVVGSGVTPSLAASGSAPVSVTTANPLTVGPHTAVLEVDHANTISESNETNNSSTHGFTVTPAPFVDLVPGAVTVSPTNPTPTQVVTLSAVVRNVGNTGATNVGWRVLVDGQVAGSGIVQSLAAAGSAPVSVTTATPLPVGQHTAVLEVDPANTTTESNETNNAAMLAFTVSPTLTIDLVAGAVTVTPSNPSTSHVVTLSASVSNVGNTAASSVGWRFLVDGQVVGSGSIPSLGATGNAPVSATTANPLAAGSHTATLEVDHANAIVESDETNNTATQSFTVSATPVIDLVAGAVTVSPANPTTSDVVTLSASVSNVGNTAASSVGWRFLVDGQVVGSGSIPSVAATGSSAVSVTTANPLSMGSHTTVLEVDHANAIVESNETNNTATQSFTVSPAQFMDLVPGTVTVSPTTPTTSQVVTVSASVRNVGNTGATNVGWRVLVDGQVAANGVIPSLAAAASALVNATAGPFGAGQHIAVLEVDPANTVAESNEDNNTATATFTVIAPVIDLVAGAVTVSPPNPTTSQVVTLSATVSNAGNTVALSVGWRFLVDGQVVGSGSIPSLAGSGNAPVSVTTPNPLSAGSHTAVLAVDHANAISESNETNNSTTQSFTVSPVPFVDLVPGAVTVSPTNPTPTQVVTLSAVVRNVGTAGATNVGWRVLIDGQVAGSGILPNLGAAASAPVSVTTAAPLPVGQHTAVLEVDPANTITESNEKNNTATQSFTVSPTPTIDLVAAAVTVTPPNPTTSQVVTLSALVSNAGNTAASNVGWRFLVDGQPVGSGSIPGLAATGNVSVSVTTPNPLAAGSHTAVLEVDSAHTILESNENNNIASLTFTVLTSPLLDLVAGALTVSPPSPTTSQVVTLRASVRNGGNAAVAGVGWRILVDGQLIGSGSLPSLTPGATAPVGITMASLLAAGPHTAVLAVDPTNTITESNETNNTSTQSFTVISQAIDLVAGAVNVSPANPTTSQVVSLSATISNTGNTTATRVGWRFLLDGQVMAIGSILTLPGAASVPLSAVTANPLPAGTHTAVLEVDPANAISEHNETNNSARQSFIVISICTLGISAGSGGTATITSGETTGPCDRQVTVTATPTGTHTFDQWVEDGQQVARANPWTFTLTQNRTLVAVFSQAPQCTLTLNANPTQGGNVAFTNGAATGDCGRTVVVRATANQGWLLQRWSDGGVGNLREVRVAQSSQELVATFQRVQCEIGLTQSTGGTIVLVSGGTQGDCGRTVVLRATANPGYSFQRWSDESTQNPKSVTLEENRTLGAVFEATVNAQEVARRLLGCLLSDACQLTINEQLFADAQGNKNGRWDLGDLLALLDKNPVLTLSQELLMDAISNPAASLRSGSVRGDKKP